MITSFAAGSLSRIRSIALSATSTLLYLPQAPEVHDRRLGEALEPEVPIAAVIEPAENDLDPFRIDAARDEILLRARADHHEVVLPEHDGDESLHEHDVRGDRPRSPRGKRSCRRGAE